MSNGIRTTHRAFRDRVQEHLRSSGHSQQELAEALDLHPKVLSRKLHGSRKAYLTQLEIRRIILTLARWQVITTKAEALHLLDLAGLSPTTFRPEEWRTSPLNALTRKRSQPLSSRLPTPLLQHNLPAPATRLIGRAWVLERLQHLLGRDEVRLVTLIGCGGSGKTRLALQVASDLVSSFAQGVWWVSLASVRDPTLVPLSILQALGIQSAPDISPLQCLLTALKNKRLLLVLDNFEQVAEAARIVDELLAEAPGLKMLVTSRAVLHLSGEHQFNVPPLDFPAPQQVSETTELSHYGALQLFVERAQAVLPDFTLTAENAAIIAEICAKVDGLPLALELAAARVKVLPSAVLLERLAHAPLAVLTAGARNLPDRQRTLRHTIAWSYGLLSSPQQTCFRRLGIFAESFSLEAAEALMQGVAGDQEGQPQEGSSLDLLEQLLDSSLLVRVPASKEQGRFKMLETLREYALEQLTTQGELEQWRDWHTWYYLSEAEAGESGLRGPEQLTWLAQMAADRENVRAAVHWSAHRARAGRRIGAIGAPEPTTRSRAVAGSRILSSQGVSATGALASEVCLRLAAAFRSYWEWQGYLPQARQWLREALEIPLEERAPPTLLAARAKVLSEASRLACLENDQGQAVELAQASIALWRQLDDPPGLATALMHRGWAAHALSEYETAKGVYQEGLYVLSSTNDLWERGQVLMYLAAATGIPFDFERMRSLYEQSQTLLEQVGDRCAVADVLKDRGAMLLLESRYTEAIDCLLGSMRLCCELGHKQYLATCLGWLSLAVGMRQEPDPETASLHSAQLKGAVESLQEAIGLTPWTRTHPLVQRVGQQIRSRADPQRWQAALTAGRALTVEQAIELAHRFGTAIGHGGEF